MMSYKSKEERISHGDGENVARLRRQMFGSH